MSVVMGLSATVPLASTTRGRPNFSQTPLLGAVWEIFRSSLSITVITVVSRRGWTTTPSEQACVLLFHARGRLAPGGRLVCMAGVGTCTFVRSSVLSEYWEDLEARCSSAGA